MLVEKTLKNSIFQLNFAEALRQLFLLFLALITLFLIILVKSRTTTEFRVEPFLFIYTIFVTIFQLSRVVGAIFYKSVAKAVANSYDNEFYEPKVTFVIPCKNEEQSIAKSIAKCFEADYPKNKLEVIVINDGSTDNTINVLNNLKPTFPQLIIVDWKINRGKRQGMAEGFRRANGEIIIQLDSDSYLDPKTFRNLISPFQNPEIGAVCAHAEPANANYNFLTKMQAAYYFISFNIFKAAESAFMTVFCCSGCSSAFRKSIVLPIIDKWLNEKFMGLPVTWGDDRALTSWVLKLGYKTFYADKVQAYTIVPTRFKQLLTQQLRWKKSWIINSIFTGRFIYKKHPFIAFVYFFPLVVISFMTPFLAFKTLVYAPIFEGLVPLYYVLGVLLTTLLIVLYYRHLNPKNKYWPYLFIWQILNMLVFCYLIVYAFVRIQDRRWGTR